MVVRWNTLFTGHYVTSLSHAPVENLSIFHLKATLLHHCKICSLGYLQWKMSNKKCLLVEIKLKIHHSNISLTIYQYIDILIKIPISSRDFQLQQFC